MNYFKLAFTTPEVLEQIAKAEKEGRFSEHLDPIDYQNALPVDEHFPYVPGRVRRLQYALLNGLIVLPFTRLVNAFVLKTKVYGRENLRGIEGAILTCNHVNKLDALAVQKAIGYKPLRIMVGDFNNQKGNLGHYMRAVGIMPYSTSPRVLRRFGQAVRHYLQKGTCILFFPERSEWWCYEKPRPLMDGAYHYAVQNQAPLVPLFITFTKTGKKDENGIELRKFHVHIGKPIYPRTDLGAADNREWMKQQNTLTWQEIYEGFYGRKL